MKAPVLPGLFRWMVAPRREACQSRSKPMNTPPRKPSSPQAKTEPKPATPRVPRAKPPTNPFGAGPITKKERQQAYADTNGVLRQRNKK